MSRARFKVKFVRLGEGRSGEYDPTDLDDVELLRIDVSYVIDGVEQPIEQDGSVCTQIPVSTDKQERRRLLRLAIKGLRKMTDSGKSLKRSIERLSWMYPKIELEEFAS